MLLFYAPHIKKTKAKHFSIIKMCPFYFSLYFILYAWTLFNNEIECKYKSTTNYFSELRKLRK